MSEQIDTAPVTPEPAPAPKADRRKIGRILTVTFLALAGVGGIAIIVDKVNEPTPIEAAKEKCSTVSAPVRDDGKTITFDNVSAKERPGPDDVVDVVCVLVELKTPSRIMSHMDSTRALDGMQTDKWEQFEARWTYHPDDGMNLTVTESEQ